MCHLHTCRSYGEPAEVLFQHVQLGKSHVVNADRQLKCQYRRVAVVRIKHLGLTMCGAACGKL